MKMKMKYKQSQVRERTKRTAILPLTVTHRLLKPVHSLTHSTKPKLKPAKATAYSKSAKPSTPERPAPAPAATRDAPPVNSGVADAVPDAEPEAEEAELEPTALADDGRGTTGVGPTTMEEEEEEGVMMGEELGLERGVRTGTETGMTGEEEEGVWVLAGATVEEHSLQWVTVVVSIGRVML